MIVATEPTQPTQYEKYRKPIQDIINFTDTIDGEYRSKCFEILLNHYISADTPTKTVSATEAPRRDALNIEDMSSETKVFLGQNNITTEMINKLFVKEKGEVHPTYKLTETRRAKAQIQIALLTALENALRGPSGVFEFSVNTVRQKCIDIKMYDGRDFYINFMDSAGLFGSLNYETIKLSATGKTELASIVLALSK
jgi:hypothetical protein